MGNPRLHKICDCTSLSFHLFDYFTVFIDYHKFLFHLMKENQANKQKNLIKFSTLVLFIEFSLYPRNIYVVCWRLWNTGNFFLKLLIWNTVLWALTKHSISRFLKTPIKIRGALGIYVSENLLNRILSIPG